MAKQKLESIAKIMLATGTLNYLASAIDGVNTEMKFIPDPNGYHQRGIDERDKLLSEVTGDLLLIMEKLADYMNGSDCISPIDIRATKQAFSIVSGRNDNVEK